MLGRADVLAEWDQQPIDRCPVPRREPGLERRKRLLRRPGVDVTPAVRHAVDMRVHRDPWLVAGDRQHQVGAFGTDARERAQHGVVTMVQAMSS